MRWILTSLLLDLCIGTAANAQAVGTAVAAQGLLVNSSVTGPQAWPAGPLPPSGIDLFTGWTTSSVWSRVRLVNDAGAPIFPAGATGWWFDGQIAVDAGGYGTVSQTGRVLLTFCSQQPVAGVIYMTPFFRHDPQFQTFSGDLTVDVNLDGVPDYFASAQQGQEANFPVTLDATGRTIAIDFSFSGTAFNVFNGISSYAEASWDIIFLPGTYALEGSASGCVPLTFWRDPYIGYPLRFVSSVTAQTQTISAGVFLLGLGPQNVALPVAPFCPVLVANFAIVPPDVLLNTGMGLFPPDVSLPPGLQFYCQAVWLDNQGNVLTSDCLRTM